MKKLILTLAWVFYPTTAIMLVDQIAGVEIIEKLNIPQPLVNIIAVLVALYWLVALCWSVYSKFYLERRERIQEYKRKAKEMEIMYRKKGTQDATP